MKPADEAQNFHAEAIAALQALVAEDKCLRERLIDGWTNHLSKFEGVALPYPFQKRFDRMTQFMAREELIADAISMLPLRKAQELAVCMMNLVLDLELDNGKAFKGKW